MAIDQVKNNSPLIYGLSLTCPIRLDHMENLMVNSCRFNIDEEVNRKLFLANKYWKELQLMEMIEERCGDEELEIKVSAL